MSSSYGSAATILAPKREISSLTLLLLPLRLAGSVINACDGTNSSFDNITTSVCSPDLEATHL
ncbi:hypothetical protein CEXT_86341, partial [Caerostris extrusa]